MKRDGVIGRDTSTLPADRGGRGAKSLGDRSAGARPSTQPSTGDRAANRPDQQPVRPQGDRDQAREDRQQNRQENQQQRQNDRQQWADQAREDRQDAWDDAFDDIDGVYYGGYGYVHVYDADDYWAGVAAIAVGAVLTLGAYEAMAKDTGCAMSQVSVEGVDYYHCGSNWYTRVVQGGNPSYLVVKPPPG